MITIMYSENMEEYSMNVDYPWTMMIILGDPLPSA